MTTAILTVFMIALFLANPSLFFVWAIAYGLGNLFVFFFMDNNKVTLNKETK